MTKKNRIMELYPRINSNIKHDENIIFFLHAYNYDLSENIVSNLYEEDDDFDIEDDIDDFDEPDEDDEDWDESDDDINYLSFD